MPDPETTFTAIATLSLFSAEIPVEKLAAELASEWSAARGGEDAHESPDPIDPAILGESLAQLIEAGRIDAYPKQPPPRSPSRAPIPVVILTALSAERLGLKLDRHSRKWVGRATKERPAKPSADAAEILEIDLINEDDTPLDQHVDPNAGEPIHEADRRERIAKMKRGLASKADRERVEMLATPELIIMGGPNSWPLPGQDRGRYAPQAVPTDYEREKGRDGLTRYRGPCSACGGPGRPLASSPTTGCGCCDRWWNDGGAGDVLKAGALEVAAAWRTKEGKVKGDEGKGQGKGKGGRKDRGKGKGKRAS